ncbi:head maturation protease, ClpP-related [Undibacterium sp. Di26W]|uniref:head maturation protease, ClpP-related n=1 Tax=Undibacterium sp. Di26W TaxID=3413035 RepID=UPI003BF43CA0
MKNWYTIKAQAGATNAEITIHDYIGNWNISASTFLSDLKAVGSSNPGLKNLDVSINSLGGSVIDGVAIYNGLRSFAEKTGATITTNVIGIAASISNLISQAGDKRKMAKNAFGMVHSPLATAQANANGMRDLADLLDKFEGSIIGTYVQRTGKTADEIKALFDAETFMTADEALAQGFIDEITPAVTLTASFSLDNLPEKIVAIFNNTNDKTDKGTKAPESKPVTKPETKPEMKTDPKADAGTTFANSILALSKQYDIEAHAESFMLDLKLTTVDQVEAAMREAVEVRDLCVFAKMPDQVSAFIAERVTLVEARKRLVDIRAEKSDKTHVDNTTPIDAKGKTQENAGGTLSPSKIYEARANFGKATK